MIFNIIFIGKMVEDGLGYASFTRISISQPFIHFRSSPMAEAVFQHCVKERFPVTVQASFGIDRLGCLLLYVF
jgi:hypothetical protein